MWPAFDSALSPQRNSFQALKPNFEEAEANACPYMDDGIICPFPLLGAAICPPRYNRRCRHGEGLLSEDTRFLRLAPASIHSKTPIIQTAIAPWTDGFCRSHPYNVPLGPGSYRFVSMWTQRDLVTPEAKTIRAALVPASTRVGLTAYEWSLFTGGGFETGCYIRF